MIKQSAAESRCAYSARCSTLPDLGRDDAGAARARVFVSGSQIRKVEAGTRTPTEDLAKACEGVGEPGCNGALTELYEILGEKLKRRAYPGWFAAWPDKEAQARRPGPSSWSSYPGSCRPRATPRGTLHARWRH